MAPTLLLRLPVRGLHRPNSAESARKIPRHLRLTGCYWANSVLKRSGVLEAREVKGQASGTTNEMDRCVATGHHRNRIRLQQISNPRSLRQQAASKMGCYSRTSNCHRHRKNTPNSRSRPSFDRRNPWQARHRLHITNHLIHILANRCRVHCLVAPRVEHPWCQRARQGMLQRNFLRDRTNQQQARREFRRR